MSYLLFIPVICTVLLWRSQEHLGRVLFVALGIAEIQAEDLCRKPLTFKTSTISCEGILLVQFDLDE